MNCHFCKNKLENKKYFSVAFMDIFDDIYKEYKKEWKNDFSPTIYRHNIVNYFSNRFFCIKCKSKLTKAKNILDILNQCKYLIYKIKQNLKKGNKNGIKV